jgi:RNA polymerase sigma-70 factor (ECF subfamily)
MRQIQSSKQSIFTEWVESYTEEFFRWAYYKTNSKETAEDLVQDTFFSAYKAYESFEKKSTAKTWLFSILNRKIIDFYRKKKDLLDVSFSEDKGTEITDSLFTKKEGWSESPVHPAWKDEKHLLDNAEFNEVLEKCMDDLPLNWREAINLKYLFNKKGNEISELLGVTKSNYWQMIHRGKLLLKKCVEVNWKL